MQKVQAKIDMGLKRKNDLQLQVVSVEKKIRRTEDDLKKKK